MSSRPTFEQAWSVIADIAKACREFNELQFKYRQLAFSLVLAVYAAIGYFWSSAEVGKKGEFALASVSGQAAATAAGSAPALPASTPRVSQSSPAVVKVQDSDAAKLEGTLGRLNFIFLGMGLLTAFSVLMIYNIDARYHGLLQANFRAASEFETDLAGAWARNAPPQIHKRMEMAVQHLHITRPMLTFYAVASVSALLPWAAFVWSHWGEMQWTRDVDIYRWVFGAVGVVALACASFFRVIYKRISGLVNIIAAPQVTKTQPATAAAPLSNADKLLLEAAEQAHANAYAAYSSFAVGAAVLASNGTDQKVFGGCNVENVSYGLTLCAERNAIAAAVAAGYRQIEKVFIYTDTPAPTVPCGACRQVIAEFGPKAEIVAQTAGAARSAKHIDALFPEPFKL